MLRLDPFTIAAPDERMNAALTVDDAKTPPLVHLTVQSPGFALAAVARGAGFASGGERSGRGAGRSERDRRYAAARSPASLDGWADVAIEGGQLDARLINAWLAGLRPLHFDGADVTDLRCFAVRADAKAGIVAIQPMALNTAGADHRRRWRCRSGARDAVVAVAAQDEDWRNRDRAAGAGERTDGRRLGQNRYFRLKGVWSEAVWRVCFLGGKDIMGAAGGGDPCPAALARARAGAPPSGAEARRGARRKAGEAVLGQGDPDPGRRGAPHPAGRQTDPFAERRRAARRPARSGRRYRRGMALRRVARRAAR